MIRTLGIEQLKPSEPRRQSGLPALTERTRERVRRFGVLRPLVVRRLDSDHFEMLCDEDIWLAAQQVGLHELPVIIAEGMSHSEAEAYTASLSDPDPITEAEELQRKLISQYGSSPSRGALTELAQQIGRHRTYVTHALRLLNLPPLVQQTLRIGALQRGHGKVLAGVSDEQRQLSLCTQAIQEHWSVHELRTHIAGAAKPARSPELKRLERQLSELVGSPVSIDEEAGVLSIDFAHSLDVLDGILMRLGYRHETSAP